MLKHQNPFNLRRPGPGPALLMLTILFATVGLGLLGAAPVQEALVRCEPELIVSDIGVPVSFTIRVEDAVDLYGADVQMAFDPSIAEVVDANPNKGGTQIEMLGEFLALDFIIRDRADNVAGTIWYANTQVNPSEAVSGSGELARVTLQSVSAGSFDLLFTSQELVNRIGETLPSSSRNCRVTFFDPNAVFKIFQPVAWAQ